MEAVAAVVLEVVEVHQRRLAEVVVGELEVPGLRRQHRLHAGRERGVAHGQRLVVGEVARLLLGGEGLAADQHRHHQVGLLHHLLAVEVEVGVVEQQRVVVGAGAGEVPAGVLGEVLRLRVDFELLVVGDRHRLRRVAPGGDLLVVDPERLGGVAVALGELGGGVEVLLRHQVGVDVVVGDRRVLVGAGDPVDAEGAVGVVVAEAAPEPRRFDQQRQADVALEVGVDVDVAVAADRLGDVGVDVEGGGARGPVGAGLGAADRPPGEGGAREAELLRPLARLVDRRQPPLERLGRRLRDGVAEHRQHVGLGVPEGVAVVAGAGQPLRRDRPALAAGARLQRVEEAEADRLLQLGVAVELDVGALPEVVEVLLLRRDQLVPAGVAGLRERRAHLVAHRRHRAPRRPAVGDELGDRQRFAGRRGGVDGEPAEVLPGLGRAVRAVLGPVDLVAHRRRRPQARLLGDVDEDARGCRRPCNSSDSSGASRAAAARGSFEIAGRGSLVTSSDWTTTRVGAAVGSTV